MTVQGQKEDKGVIVQGQKEGEAVRTDSLTGDSDGPPRAHPRWTLTADPHPGDPRSGTKSFTV